MRSWTILGLALFPFAVWPGPALADLIGPDCATCQGSTYTLSSSGASISSYISGGTAYDVWRVILDIDTGGYTPPSGVTGPFYVDTVAVKVTDGNSLDLSHSAIFEAPGDDLLWALSANGVNAGGCGSQAGGSLCASDTTQALVGGLLRWQFDIAVMDGHLFTDPWEAHVGARYVRLNSAGSRVKVGDLVSEDISLQFDGGGGPQEVVPEPASIGLLGSVLAALALALRRARPVRS